MQDQSPLWARFLPLITGGGYFLLSRYYKKESLPKAITWAILAGIVGAMPWFAYNRKKPMPAILSSASSNNPNSSNLDSMNKAGRQEAISYILAQEGKSDGIKLTTSPKVSPEAYESLTNDELKSLYLIYKFVENKQAILDEYKGQQESDELAKKIAKQKFGVNADGIKNIKEASTSAIAKISNFYLKQTA